MNEQKILERLQSLRYKDDSVTIEGVYPSMLELMFSFNGGIRIIGGRDLDYEGETNEYIVSGSAYYGTCEFVKKHGSPRPSVELNVESDKYTRTAFDFNGREIKNIPPAILYNNESIYKLDLSYKLFYIAFSHYGFTTLHPFYAKREIDVRHRALSIWGKYDAIMTNDEIEDIQIKNGKYFELSYHILETVYVLEERN